MLEMTTDAPWLLRPLLGLLDIITRILLPPEAPESLRGLYIMFIMASGMAFWLLVFLWLVERAGEQALRAFQRWRKRHIPVELREADPDLSEHRAIIELMREIGAPLDKAATWTLGAKARTLYEEKYGVPPRKALRTKASGKGSHDHAVYPPQILPEIRALILAELDAIAARQARQPAGLSPDNDPTFGSDEAAHELEDAPAPLQEASRSAAM